MLGSLLAVESIRRDIWTHLYLGWDFGTQQPQEGCTIYTEYLVENTMNEDTNKTNFILFFNVIFYLKKSYSFDYFIFFICYY